MTTQSFRLKLIQLNQNRLKLTQANNLKLKVNARIPASIEATSPIMLDKTGGIYTLSLDMNAINDTIGISFQPADADLTAIAALTTTAYGRSLLTLANATALAAEVDSFFLTPAEGNAAYQPLDSDLTAIAALTTTSYGRAFLALADAAAARTAIGAVIGTNVQAWDADLDALAANSTNGLWARTGAGTGAARTITGTANEITLTNGNGVSGNPTASLPASLTFTGKTVTGGAFIGGTLDNANVGATTAASVRGTTITSTDTTDSSSTSTGAVVTSGGVGVAKAASFGSTIGVGGAAVAFAGINFSGTIGNTGGSSFVQRSAATVSPANGSIGYGGYFGMVVDTGASNVLPYSVGGYFPPLTKSGTGSITKVYGIYCDPQTIASTNNYSAYFGGNVTIGSETGAGRLSVTGGKLQLAAATSSYPALNLPVGGPPSSPTDGDIWLESNTNTGLKIRINGVTKTVTLT